MDENILSSINAGGSTFYTFSLFFFCICFFVFLNSRKWNIKYFALGCAIMSSIYILGFCYKASVVVYYFVAVVFLIYAKRAKKIGRFITVLIVTGGVVFILIDVYEDEIIEYIISISPSERLTIRLVSLIDINAEEAQEATITGRTNLYMLSLNTWLDNPGNFLFGIGDHWVEFEAGKTGIGQHSDLLDILGRYGIVGLVLIYQIMKNAFKFVLSFFDSKYKLQIISILILYIFCGLTKVVFNIVEYPLFLLLPLSSIFVNKGSSPTYHP